MFATTLTRVTALAALFSLLSGANASADPQDFLMINNTYATVTQIYYTAANNASDPWHAVNGDQIGAGQSSQISFSNADACVFDLKVVLSDGTNRGGQFNLCNDGSITIN